MKCEVKLFVAGKVFSEEVHARNYDEARQVAVVALQQQSQRHLVVTT